MKPLTNSHFKTFAVLATLTLIIVGIISSTAYAIAPQGELEEIEGFTQPFRKIDLSSDETGAIATLAIREGDRVEAGDVVANLDSRVQDIQLQIAKKMASSTSQRSAAAKSLTKRRAISQRLEQMHTQGHASESEIIRADLELSIAESKYNTAVEEAAIREIEVQRAAVQLQRRTITAPFNGQIAKIHSREGEFLSPLHPEICTIVQTDKLLATFNVTSDQARQFVAGQSYELRLENGETVSGEVYIIGVETDPQSGTVEIKLVIDNSDYRIRSGENVTLNI
jgi:RND family efflux transporter MFP subunit